MISRPFISIVYSPDDEAESGKGWWGSVSDRDYGSRLQSPLFETRDELLEWARKRGGQTVVHEATD